MYLMTEQEKINCDKLKKLLLLTFRGLHIETGRLAAAQRRVLPRQNRHGLRHVLLQVRLGRKQRLHPMFLLLLALSLPVPVPLLLAVCQNLTEGRHHVRRSVGFLFLAADFVFELAHPRFGFAGTGEVTHAGGHVGSHELDVH